MWGGDLVENRGGLLRETGLVGKGEVEPTVEMGVERGEEWGEGPQSESGRTPLESLEVCC